MKILQSGLVVPSPCQFSLGSPDGSATDYDPEKIGELYQLVEDVASGDMSYEDAAARLGSYFGIPESITQDAWDCVDDRKLELCMKAGVKIAGVAACDLLTAGAGSMACGVVVPWAVDLVWEPLKSATTQAYSGMKALANAIKSLIKSVLQAFGLKKETIPRFREVLAGVVQDTRLTFLEGYESGILAAQIARLGLYNPEAQAILDQAEDSLRGDGGVGVSGPANLASRLSMAKSTFERLSTGFDPYKWIQEGSPKSIDAKLMQQGFLDQLAARESRLVSITAPKSGGPRIIRPGNDLEGKYYVYVPPVMSEYSQPLAEAVRSKSEAAKEWLDIRIVWPLAKGDPKYLDNAGGGLNESQKVPIHIPGWPSGAFIDCSSGKRKDKDFWDEVSDAIDAALTPKFKGLSRAVSSATGSSVALVEQKRAQFKGSLAEGSTDRAWPTWMKVAFLAALGGSGYLAYRNLREA